MKEFISNLHLKQTIYGELLTVMRGFDVIVNTQNTMFKFFLLFCIDHNE